VLVNCFLNVQLINTVLSNKSKYVSLSKNAKKSTFATKLLDAIDWVIPPSLFSVDKTEVIFNSEIKQVCGRTKCINMHFHFICKKVGYMSIAVS
jgi:hypothetical protein